jgi:uncharacterized membrane protein HdeD (DUF308 family)
MGSRKNAVKPKGKKNSQEKKNTFAFTRKNYLTLLAGLVVIVLGFITLRMGSITLAPLLLVVGYCVIIPIGILLRPKKTKEEEQQQPSVDR